MTDQQIKEEAARRLEGMTAAEKRALFGNTEEENAFLDYVAKVGVSNLTPRELSIFRRLSVDLGVKTMPGGIMESGIVSDLEERYNITKDDLCKGVKNPYKKEILILVAVGLGVAVTGGVLLGLGSRFDIEWLKYVGAAVEFGNGFTAYRIWPVISASMSFRKVQKKYMSGKMDEELIRCEMLSQYLAEWQKEWK